MSDRSPNSAPSAPPHGLPSRDWLLLPLIVLSVIFVFLGTSELLADRMFPQRGRFTCETTDQLGVPREKPNCVFHYKNAEGPFVEYRFNECGYRSSKPCGAKPRDTLRVVLMGSSMTMGLFVPSDETYAVRTEAALSRICGRPVEVQNMGGPVHFWDQPNLVGEALRLSPDVIVLAVAPFNIEEEPTAGQGSDRHSKTVVERIGSAWHDLELKVRATKFVFAAQHFMLLDTQVLYEAFTNMGASREVFNSPQTPVGERKYAEFAKTLDQTMAKLNGSGVPLVVMAVPNRFASAVLSNRSHLEGLDPLWFGRHVSEIAVRDGALALDVTPEFAAYPHAERLFYPVDNHPTGEGNAVIARALVDRLTDGSIPQLAACRTAQSGSR